MGVWFVFGAATTPELPGAFIALIAHSPKPPSAREWQRRRPDELKRGKRNKSHNFPWANNDGAIIATGEACPLVARARRPLELARRAAIGAWPPLRP